MKDKVISWYSGHRGEQYPLIFRFKSEEKRVKRLIQSEIVEDGAIRGKRNRRFLVESLKGDKFWIIVGEMTKVIPLPSDEQKKP